MQRKTKELFFKGSLVFFMILSFGYLFLNESLEAFWLLQASLSICYFVSLYLLKDPKINFNNHLKCIFLMALVTRVPALLSEPFLESDFWRYIWDGHILSNALNPYHYLPLDTRLDHLELPFRVQVAHTYHRTIYPPVSQVFFALITTVLGSSVFVFKMAFTALNFISAFLLVKMSRAKAWVAVAFLFNPLLIKETANSCHLDALSVFFVVLTFYCFYSKNPKHFRFWPLVLALGVGSKIYPLFFFPFLLKASPKKKQNLLFFLGALVLFYLPFVLTSPYVFQSTSYFAKYWSWNALPFDFLIKFFGVYKADYVLLVSLALICFWALCGFDLKNKNYLSKLLNLFAIALLFSPVVQPWYLCWILPLAILSQSTQWLLVSSLIMLGYVGSQVGHQTDLFSQNILWLEYILIALALASVKLTQFLKITKAKTVNH